MWFSFRKLLTSASCILMIIFFGGSKQMNNRNTRNWQQLTTNTYQLKDTKSSETENSTHQNDM